MAAVAFVLGSAASRSVAAEALYTAVMSNGERISGGHLSNWGNSDQPKINGRPLHDQANPIRWLRRETADQPALPTAYLEMVGGDVMPGRVIGMGATSTVQEGELGSFLSVEPTTPVNRPDGPPRGTVRILTRWLRRIVWQRRSHDQYEPSTLFFKDGRQLAFRSIRFRDDALSVLTDNGRREVPMADVAELHMPRIDWWNAYFEQLALLTPYCKLRLLRLESLDGLRATVSPDRVEVVPWGDANNQDFWYQAVQPAWSMDALFLRHARILMRQYFGPHEVPLSMIEPSQIRLRSAMAVGWRPLVDRNVQGGPLISGDKEFGWGLGTQAYTEMDFPLPSCAVSFHSTVGLDRVVGSGGCARAIVYAQKAEGQPLYRSDHLIGSQKLADTGLLPLNGNVPNAQLVIVSHPDSADRPAGADPLDIRDVVDWLEPQLNLDLEKLRAEVRSRLVRQLPGLDGWTVADGDDGRMTFDARWDKVTRSFHFEFRPEASAVVLKRSLRIEPAQNWLLLYVNRNAEDGITSQTDAVVRIDGKPAGEFNVPARWEDDPPPLKIPVDKFQGQQIALEVRLVSRGKKSYVDWRSAEIVDRLPTLAEVFEDEVQRPTRLAAVDGDAAVVTIDRYSGTACIKLSPKGKQEARAVLGNLNLPIREHPRFGEYRYLCFAWRKSGGQQIGLDLDYVLTDLGQTHQKDRWRRVDRIKQLRTIKDNRRQAEDLVKMRQKDANNSDPNVLAQLRKLQRHLDRLKQIEAQLQAQQDALDQELTGAAGAGVRSHLEYYTGRDVTLPIDTRGIKLADTAPQQWTIVTRDLFQESAGGGQLTGIALVCPDGDYALLDHVYLARAPEDFSQCPPQAAPITTK
ncbi:MAG TPA: NPCBM/NEW2 domain-containing protein [Pirellulales bacterium]|nr:NPCBM/NEW2 domain-containing protein [Pirellulales bacterium]